ARWNHSSPLKKKCQRTRTRTHWPVADQGRCYGEPADAVLPPLPKGGGGGDEGKSVECSFPSPHPLSLKGRGSKVKPQACPLVASLGRLDTPVRPTVIGT